jgi:putative transposase
MPNYRRLRIPGGTFFFTVNLQNRRTDLLIRHVEALRGAYRYVTARYPFETLAICILPEHFHCVWKLPPGDDDYSTRIRPIKEHFVRGLPEGVAPGGVRKGEAGVWPRRFWEHAIRDERDLDAHIDYVHFNPVRHGYAADPDHWPHSTWRRWKIENNREPARFELKAGEA